MKKTSAEEVMFDSAANQAAESETASTTDAVKFTNADQPANETVKPAPSSSDLAALTTKVTELTSDLQRTRADFENYRKQVEAQRSQSMTIAAQATVEKFLPLIDDFDRALSTYPEQLAPLAKGFAKTLKDLKLEKITSAEGTEFNPDFHEAVSVVDEGGDSEVVAETLRSGYLYDGAVIRAAMVKVKRI